MRVIAGEHRGRRIDAPPGIGTRPMLDRVREALFATLGDRVEGARVLDLFAGSGSLGIEALSRGAARAVFVESDREVLAILRQNLATLGLEERSEVRRGDAFARELWGDEHELALLDPPYTVVRDARRRSELLAAVGEVLDARVAPGGMLVLHAPRGALAAEAFGPGRGAAERTYGSTSLWYLEAAR